MEKCANKCTLPEALLLEKVEVKLRETTSLGSERRVILLIITFQIKFNKSGIGQHTRKGQGDVIV